MTLVKLRRVGLCDSDMLAFDVDIDSKLRAPGALRGPRSLHTLRAWSDADSGKAEIPLHGRC
jgi:hypothetical protein